MEKSRIDVEFRVYSLGFSADRKFIEIHVIDDEEGAKGTIRLRMEDVARVCALANPGPKR